MRKLLWSCVGLGVLTAGGFYLAANYACRHPASVVGRCVIATLVQPLAGLGTMVVGSSTGGPLGGDAAGTATEEMCIPDDPTPVAEEAPVEPAPPLPVSGVLEAPQAEVRAPAPIVIHEEPEPATPPQPEEPSESESKEPSGTPTVATASGPAVPEKTYPPLMPYCTDDATPMRMPYADENEDSGAGQAGTDPDNGTSWWQRLFHLRAPEGRVPGGAEPSEPDGASDCREDGNYHQHYSGCPYTGRCCPDSPKPKAPVSARPDRKPHGKGEAGEEQEPPAEPETHGQKQHYKGCRDGDDCPRHPEVDTMEFRPSDRGLNEYGPGGPL
jgi:hypothetical protein